MLRTRLLWFSAGLGSTAAVVSHLVWKDLLVDRHQVSSHMTNKFHALDTRLSHLESTSPLHSSVSDHHHHHDQVDD